MMIRNEVVDVSMVKLKIWVDLILILATAPAAGQQPSPKKPSKLVAGKLVYVAPMPGNLDRWILDDLRVWGKYKPTGDPEGVDLVIRADAPEKPAQYKTREGIPQRRRDRPGPPAVSISVLDWVTSETLWHADLLDRKPKKDEADPPAGPHTHIFAHGLTTDQIGEKLTAKLREYVNELEAAEGRKQ